MKCKTDRRYSEESHEYHQRGSVQQRVKIDLSPSLLFDGEYELYTN